MWRMQHKSNDCHIAHRHTEKREGGERRRWKGEELELEAGQLVNQQAVILQQRGLVVVVIVACSSCGRRDQLKWQMTPMRIPIIIGIVIIIVITVCFRLHSSGTGHAQVISALWPLVTTVFWLVLSEFAFEVIRFALLFFALLSVSPSPLPRLALSSLRSFSFVDSFKFRLSIILCK